MDSEYVTATAQLIQIGVEEYLNIDLFYAGRRQARYFADVNEHDWCVHINGQWKRMRINNVARVIQGKEVLKGGEFWYGGDQWKFASERDKKLATGYIDTYSVNSFEETVTWEKAQKATQRKSERIADLMAIVDPVPDRAMQWLDEEIFPEHYLFVTDNKKTRKYACTKCGAHSWTKMKYKNYEMTQCPKCKATVKVEKRLDVKFKYANVVILQAIPLPIGSKWVERQFRAETWWTPGGKRINLHENIRAIIPKGQKWGKVYYGTKKNADEYEQEWWDTNSRGQQFRDSYLYPYNLDEVLPYGELEHSGIDILAKQKLKFNVNKAIVQDGSRPWMEYLIKTGMTNMAVEIINAYGWWGNPSALNVNGGCLSELLQIDGNRANRIKQINGGMDALAWLQYEETTGIRVPQEVLEYLAKNKLRPDDCMGILQELKSTTRMMNYMKKQKVKPSRLMITWRDYLRMAREEGYDTTDDIVRLPKDLKARHDELVEIRTARQDAEEQKRNAKKYAALNREIRNRIPDAKKYYYEDSKYMIVPAGTCEELIEEGRKLHHCVGASDIYMNRMADGTSWILFLRKKEDLEKPYYTIEIDMRTDEIKQWYSEYDRKPDQKTISKVLGTFKKNIGRQQTQNRVLVAAIA
jgi:hypothetical protein